MGPPLSAGAPIGTERQTLVGKLIVKLQLIPTDGWFNDRATTFRQVFGVKAQLKLGLTTAKRASTGAVPIASERHPLAALQAATINPARAIQGTDSLGTVAAGRLADLVLLDANPLADITNTTQISAVVANGRYFDRAALDGLVAEIRAKVGR